MGIYTIYYNIIGKVNLYFVIYDFFDNFFLYVDNCIELSLLTGIRTCDINYRFKGRDYIVKYIDERAYKIYRFFD